MFNRTYEGRGINGGGITEGDNYGYDELYRLTTFERDVPAADLGNLGQGQQAELRQYEIDGVQNWQELIVDGQSTTIQANSVNEYTDFGADQPTYDGRGNMITSGGTPNITYRYDFLNRLREVEDVGASKKLEYVYDAHGRRVAVRRTGATPIPEIPDNTEFVYDGIQVIEERAVMQGGLARRFVMGRSLDEPVRLDVDGFYPGTGSSFYYQQNPLGSVMAIGDGATGAVVERYGYDAYGMPVVQDSLGAPVWSSTSLFGNPYVFMARRYEPAVGPLMHYRSRTYDPAIGRFLQRDTVGIWADSLNLGSGLAYVGCNPVNFFDPLGQTGQAGAAAAAAGAAMVDGPIPIGDIVGVGILICAAVTADSAPAPDIVIPASRRTTNPSGSRDGGTRRAERTEPETAPKEIGGPKKGTRTTEKTGEPKTAEDQYRHIADKQKLCRRSIDSIKKSKQNADQALRPHNLPGGSAGGVQGSGGSGGYFGSGVIEPSIEPGPTVQPWDAPGPGSV